MDDRYHQAVEAGVFDDVPVELLRYAEVGILEYWVINLKTKELIVALL